MSDGIPQGWNTSKLGEISDIRFSNVDKKSYPETEIPVQLCNYMDVYSNNNITNHLDFMTATAKQREIDKFTLKYNDVIITKDSETPDDIAISAFVSETLTNVICGYHLALISPSKERMDGRFLHHLFGLDKIQHNFYLLANGITRYGLTSGAISDALITYPPSPEQQKIASILTSVDEVIEKTESQISKLQDLKKGIMQELLTKGIGHTEFKDSPVGRIPKEWEVVALGDVGKWKGGGTPSKSNSSYWSGNIPWVSPKDMKSEIITETQDSISEEAITGSSTSRIVSNSLLMVVRSGILKHTLPIAIAGCDLTINQDMKGLDVSSDFSLLYLFHYLQANNHKVLRATLKAGNTVESLDFNLFSSYLIPYPPLGEQINIANSVESIASRIHTKKLILNSIRKLKKSLMQDLLTGKVRVKVN